MSLESPQTLKEYLEAAQAGPLGGETEEQFRERIVNGALAIQGRLDGGEESTIARPTEFDQISTPGSTRRDFANEAQARETFGKMRAELERIARDKNRKMILAAIAGIALVGGTVAAGGVPSIGAIAAFAAKGLSALFADGAGQDATEEA